MYPILFEFGPITIFSLWFFIAIGFAVGSYIFVQLAKRNRLRLSVIFDHAFSLFFWTLVISRLTFIVFHTDLYFYQFTFRKLWSILAVWDKGLSFWGAISAWGIGVWFLSRKRNESPLKIFDIMLPAVLFGMFFGNIGAFLDGINYGTPTNLPWGLTFLSANVKYISPIHPTQLYGALYSVSLASGLLLLLQKTRGNLPGFATEIGIFAFSLFRFLEEFLRGDESVKILSIRLPQILAVLTMALTGYLIYLRYTNKTGGDPKHLLQKFVTDNLLKRKRQNLSTIVRKKTQSLQNQTA